MSTTRAAAKGLAPGRFTLDPVVEFRGPRMPPTQMFPMLTAERAADLLARVPAEGFDAASSQLVTSVHSWLVRSSDGMVMLVDTCSGNNKPRPNFPIFHMQKTDWLAKLAALGVTPDQVTHVINTHLHHDHVGWNTVLDGETWRATFPRARYLMPRLEVAAGPQNMPSWNDGAFGDSVAPILAAGLAELVDPPFVIAPGLTLCAAPGHSPGMMILEVSDDAGAGVLAGGDPMHHALQVFAPELNTRFCQDQELAAATRRRLLERCADEAWSLAATHFAAPRVLSVSRQGAEFALS